MRGRAKPSKPGANQHEVGHSCVLRRTEGEYTNPTQLQQLPYVLPRAEVPFAGVSCAERGPFAAREGPAELRFVQVGERSQKEDPQLAWRRLDM